MQNPFFYVIIDIRDVKIYPCSFNTTRPSVEKGQKKTRRRSRATMNKYELALVVNAKIEDEARSKVVEDVKGLVTRFGGTITDIDEWGKKKLAYEIQKMSEGFYYFIHFEAESSAPGEIESRIRIMENVLRFLCVRQEA